MIGKETRYRGKELKELKEMSIREFAKCVNSRERRTILKQDDVIEKFLKKCKKYNEKGKVIKTHQRDIIIVPGMIDYTIQVYNGKTFIPVKITLEMLGHRLGEFSLTRQTVKHGAPGIGATRSSAAASVK